VVPMDRESTRPNVRALEAGLAIRVRGTVQGVGFRPFIYRLAREHRLRGFVSNTPDGVLIEVAGDPAEVSAFVRDVPEKKPPLARITAMATESMEFEAPADFAIRGSQAAASPTTLIPPDVATCAQCLRELFDPSDRRYRYPFINCTDCGPRYTLIRGLPYDRPLTTMASFTLCEECRHEYENPLDRRFHAEPTACPRCGPRVLLLDERGREVATADPIADVVRSIGDGAIVAIKGVGGFHLAVDATCERAVLRLRERKHREEKPLAVMAADLKRIAEFCRVSADEASLLTGAEKPIVLLEKTVSSRLAPSVAPGQARLGVMLPYTPLHALVLESPLYAIVLTSGNRTDEPIAYRNEEALERLSGIADVFLVHDREIHRRADDSVARVVSGSAQLLRRARGYAPRPVRLAFDAPPVLAVGGQLKNTICLTRDRDAFLSCHLGDLDHPEAYRSFEETIDHLSRALEVHPRLVAHDLHPDYLSTRWALDSSGLPAIGVQHHHAHIAAVLAEQGREGPVVGIALDGTGYGTDGQVWGGEILVADLTGFCRAAHLPYVPLLGGERAVRETWRMGLSWLYRLYGSELFRLRLPLLALIDRRHAEGLLDALGRGISWPLTSSCGRLFDAVAAIIGLRQRVSYEGQAPMELEGLAERGTSACEADVTCSGPGPNGEIPIDAVLQAVVREVEREDSAADIAARFHVRLSHLLVASAAHVADEARLDTVALGGGCFQNRILLERVRAGLEKRGLTVLTPLEVPAGDGGLSLGQAAVASRRLRGVTWLPRCGTGADKNNALRPAARTPRHLSR